jgi:hypothetical protein
MKWLAFVGEGRSGHSVVAAILDAHPNAYISDEAKVMGKWYNDKFKKDDIFRWVSSFGIGKEWPVIVGQRVSENPLLVIGDKCGWEPANLYKKSSDIDILHKFGGVVGCDIKIIHTTRNPYDNIAAWFQSSKYKRMWGKEDTHRLRMAVRRYVKFYQYAEDLLGHYDVYHLRNEELCKAPRREITRLCEFLELPVIHDYVRRAAEVVNSKPNRRSLRMDWPDNYLEMVRWRIIDRFPSLAYYRGDSC